MLIVYSFGCFAPVKRFTEKIVSKMIYNLSSRTLSHAVSVCLYNSLCYLAQVTRLARCVYKLSALVVLCLRVVSLSTALTRTTCTPTVHRSQVYKTSSVSRVAGSVPIRRNPFRRILIRRILKGYHISSINSDALIIQTRNFFEKIIIFSTFNNSNM